MGTERINIEKFLELAEKSPVLDVRSPAEFKQAHIPGAFSLALFNDEERKIVGTIYKQQSREAAIKAGLDFFGPKMRSMVEETEKIVGSRKFEVRCYPSTSNIQPPTSNTVLVHCWRGGMRSAAVAWLLDLYGFKVYTLAGGYKAFRNWVIKQFTTPHRFYILGGYTGSGKTEVLSELERNHELVIDLEALANHKGSAFGNIGLPPQPSQEMFENLLGLKLNVAGRKSISNGQPIWMEDESQRIGTVNIPQPLWLTMRSSPVYFLDISFETRLQHILAEYGQLDKVRMADAIGRVQKRLGPLETKTALVYLEENRLEECFHILLKYYDKYYQRGLNNRHNLESILTRINCNSIDPAINGNEVLKSIQSISV